MADEFEVGEEVVIVKNLGSGSSYYYGGDLFGVPLQTEGKISKKRSNGGYQLLLNSGSSWSVHSEEIESCSFVKKLEKELLEFGGVDRHSLFEMGQEAPLFIVDEKVYSLSDASNGQNDEGDYLEFYKKIKIPLQAMADLGVLDNLFFERNSDKIKCVQKKYAENVSKRIMNSDAVCKNMNVAELIYNKVFPHLRSRGYEKKIAGILSESSDSSEEILSGSQKDKMQDKIQLDIDKITESLSSQVNGLILKMQKEKSDLEKRNESEKSRPESKLEEKIAVLLAEELGVAVNEKKEPESLFGKVLEGKNVCFMNGLVYEIKDVLSEEKYLHSLDIAGNKLYLIPSKISILDIEKEYLFHVSRQISIGAIKEHLSHEKIKKALEAEQKKFSAVAYLENYEEEDFGFLNHDGSYYAYLKVPAFAVKSQFDGNYYVFNSTKLAMRIIDSTLRTDDAIYMTEPNNHPFLHFKNDPFALVCMGSSLNISTIIGKDNGEAIAKKLRKAKEVLMYGYGNYGLCYDLRDLCASCKKDHYAQNRKSWEEVEKRGMPVAEGGLVVKKR